MIRMIPPLPDPHNGIRRTHHVMNKLLFTLSLAAAVASNVVVAALSAAPPSHEFIEWCDIWISHANDTNLPRVLLIGDSIARDYYGEVEKRLDGKAFVARLATSRFIGDPVLLKEIELALGGTKFDVVHFNNGMHGWQHTEAEYRKTFPKLIKTIRAYAPRAKLIWATTTPLRDGQGVTGDTKAEYSDKRIDARNAIAAEILMRGHPEYHSDNVHFNGQGIQIQAAQVSGEILKVLP
jgi:hypothetical protein